MAGALGVDAIKVTTSWSKFVSDVEIALDASSPGVDVPTGMMVDATGITVATAIEALTAAFESFFAVAIS